MGSTAAAATSAQNTGLRSLTFQLIFIYFPPFLRHRARRCRPSGGPDAVSSSNEHQGGAMHRPYGGYLWSLNYL
jgi:hypothetical protein